MDKRSREIPQKCRTKSVDNSSDDQDGIEWARAQLAVGRRVFVVCDEDGYYFAALIAR